MTVTWEFQEQKPLLDSTFGGLKWIVISLKLLFFVVTTAIPLTSIICMLIINVVFFYRQLPSYIRLLITELGEEAGLCLADI